MVRPKYLKQRVPEEGFGTVGIALVISLLVGTALLTTVSESWYGASSSAKEDLANAAREAAEAGAEEILAKLNTSYPYLLVVDDEEWAEPPTNSSLCSGSPPNSYSTEITSGSIGDSSNFELVKYDFEGNNIFGGNAKIQVKGIVSNNNNLVTATAIVEKVVQIAPKNCKSPLDSPNISGFPGLWAQKIVMGNNDIYGSSGNVLCTECRENIPNNCSVDSETSLIDYTQNDKRCVIGGKNNMIVGGDIYIGPADFPSVPTIPSTFNNVSAANISSSTTIKAGGEASELLDGSCIVNAEGITQCKVEEINLTGTRKLIIDTSNGGPVQIYLVGNKISLKGRSTIQHIPLTASAAKVAIFGNPIDIDDSNDQLIELKGRTQINNIWTYIPDGKIGISGGGNVSYSCTGSGSNIDCSGGNIHGAVWAKEWGLSNSNTARITIPLNMGGELETFYPGFRLGNKSYVAAGTSSFRTLNIAAQDTDNGVQ